MNSTLPTGARGHALALGLIFVVAALAWLVGVAPLMAWHGALSEELAGKERLATRMSEIAATLPQLQAEAARAPAERNRLLPAANDALASAAVLENVQALAASAGLTLISAEAIPVETVAAQYRRAGVRVLLSGDWPALAAVLQAVDQQSVQLFADDIQIGTGAALIEKERKMEMSVTVFGLRAAPAAP